MIDAIGWLGAFLFSACGLPQAVKCAKDGHSRGLSWAFLGMWAGGEILTIVYVMATTRDNILLANYFVNMVFLVVMLRYKLVERR
jgi:hypothetical protein